MLLSGDSSAFDASFGTGGKVRFDLDGLGDKATWVRALPDGKILVSGTSTAFLAFDPNQPPGQPPGTTGAPQNHRFLARLRADGSFDAAFGEGGVVRFSDFSPGSDALAIQPDGKILVGGRTNTIDGAFAVARFNPDGTIDAGFGDQGVAAVNLDTQPVPAFLPEQVTSLAVQPDGKLVAAGLVDKPGTGPHALPSRSVAGVVRFNSDGTVDEPFGRHVEDLHFLPRQILIEPDGQVVVGGDAGGYWSNDPVGGFRFARFNPDGTFDTSFGQGGAVAVDLPAAYDSIYFARMTDLVLQPDGKLAAAGNIGSEYFGVVRLNDDGSRDAAFDADGVVLGRGVQVSFYGTQIGQYRLRYAPAGGTLQVAAVGHGKEVVPRSSPTEPVIERVTGLQVFSAELGADGKVVAAGRAKDLPMTGAERVAAAAIQEDGRIVGVGSAHPTQDAGEGAAYAQTADALVVRFDPAGIPAVADALSFSESPPAPAPLTGQPGTGQPVPVTRPSGSVVLNGVNGNGVTYNDASTGGPRPSMPVVVADGESPTPATFSGPTVVRGGRAYTFRIGYPSETLARQTPVSVTGPNGFSTPAQAVKVKVQRAPKGTLVRLDVAGAARPALATYRAPAPGGKFDAADAGTYAVRLNATGGHAASGQVVGLFSAGAGRNKRGSIPEPVVRIVVNRTGVLRNSASIAGNATGWVLDRTETGWAGAVVDLDLGRFPGEAASLNGRLVTVTGVVQTQNRPGRGAVPVFVVESISAAM